MSKREIFELLRGLRAGEPEPGSKEGQDILMRAFKEDLDMTLKMTDLVPKVFLERGMKLAGFNSAEIGHSLYPDPLSRAEFFAAERRRADRIGAIGHDDFGYPIGFGVKDPFDTAPTARALAEADPTWMPIEEVGGTDAAPEDEDLFPSPMEEMQRRMLRGPRPS